MKYSSNENRAVSANEIAKIIKDLKAGATRATQAGKRVTGYVLITNRGISEAAQVRYESELPKLRIVRAKKNYGRQKLTEFAQQYGCTDQEIDHGITVLLGEALEDPNNSVTKGTLVQAFTGDRRTMRLIPHDISIASREQLLQFREKLAVHGEVIHRTVIERLQEVVQRRAFVILQGGGGVGKSLALWQWANSMVAPEPPQAGVFTYIGLASEVPERGVADIISNWRHPLSSLNRVVESCDESWERLNTSNKNTAHPLLFLGLDGVDERIETSEQRRHLENVIK